MANNKQIKFIQGSAILIASNFVIKGINFLLLPFYTRYLTPELLGVSDSVSNLTAFLFPLLVMGLDSAFSAFYFDVREERHYLQVYNTIRIALVISSMVPILLALGSKAIAEILFKDDRYYVLVAISLISVSFNLWHLPFSLLARMRNRMGIFALVNTSSSLLMIVLNIVFLTKFGLGAYSLVLSTCVVQFSQLIMYEILLRERLNLKLFDSNLLQRMLRYSAPLVPNAIAVWVLALSDRFIILHYCGEAEVGLYGIGARFATAVSLVANGIYMSYTTYAFEKKGDDNDKEYYSRILNAFVLAIIAICFTLSVWAKEVVSIMTTSDYSGTIPMIAPLLFSQLFYGINTLIGYSITFEKKSQYILLSTSAGAIINVLLNLFFVPYYGATAASYTTLASYVLMCAITYKYGQKTYPVPYNIAKILISVIATLIIACASPYIPTIFRAIGFILTVGIILKVYEPTVNDYYKLLKRILCK